MREALKGFDFNRALKVLQDKGILPKPGTDGKSSHQERIYGEKKRVYPVSVTKLGESRYES